ncbi:MAG TPA: isoprenylcysteine carboxylmethyltransferase family protein [Candidatus Acidoferrales bacterium]|nr:isoprenylcysteine carboxylmethyltransferase family protein [Candidatus Acidoferrales bacterium]
MIVKWIAVAVFFLQLPNPIFWLVLHPQMRFWRNHVRAAYITALMAAWGLVTIFLVAFHSAILRRDVPSDVQIGAGLLLIALDLRLFAKVRRDMGTSRLIGKTELAGGGEVASAGIYSRIRHPRYAGMLSSVLGACLLVATPLMWGIAAAWFLLVMIVIGFEERELRARLGEAYAEYCQRVPRFIPRRNAVHTK